MVDHHIQQHGDIVLLQGVDRRQQLRFVAIFGGDRPFLIKLAEVKEIVGIIADGVLWSSFFGHADQMVGLCTGGQLGGRA
ncbi:hypothetical protein R1M90_14630, partial [Klebsiella sp. 79945]